MSTRWCVGVLSEDESFRGRYVHCEGYPASAGRVLTELLARFDGGIGQLLDVLTIRNYGWSYLDPKTTADATHVGHSKIVEGVGAAYTDLSPNDWIEGRVGHHCPDDIEWAYLFTAGEPHEAELVVINVPFIERVHKVVDRIPVLDLHKIDWANFLASVEEEREEG